MVLHKQSRDKDTESNSNVFSFQTKRTPLKPEVKFDGMDIAYKSETKFLGIFIGENMRWDVHVHSLTFKLSKICYMI
jgi:hypothetical protein